MPSFKPLVKEIDARALRDHLPEFRVGDTIKVNVKIREGEKERIQAFEGVVIKKRDGQGNASFTVRKISYGVGVERIFPTHSPRIDSVQVMSRGEVRRNRLFYLRALRGKAARIKAKLGEAAVAATTPTQS